jgi:hypothetical protein
MEYLVTKTIPIEELTEYKDYIGFLFKNQNGVYNICDTEEDVIKSNQWFMNLPLNAIIVSDEKVEIGDVFLGIATNKDLNGKTFKFMGYTKDAVDLIDIKDKDGNIRISTIHLLRDAYKFIRVANKKDKEGLINGVIRKLDI